MLNRQHVTRPFAERLLMMTKKIMLFALILFLAGASILLVLPSDRGLGQKACQATILVKGKAQHLVQPLPKVTLPDVAESDPDPGHPAGREFTTAAARIPVLMYHAVLPAAENPDPANGSIINLESFADQMAYLHEEGYYTASLAELEQFVHGRLALPEKTVVLTFDDGYENNVIHAYPILKQYNFRAAMFLIGSYVRGDGEPVPEGYWAYFTDSQMADTRDVFEFHSHTYDLHYKIPGACGKTWSATGDTALLQHDIDQIKAIGIDTPYYAYPYGYHTRPMVSALIENGYRMAFTTKRGFVEPGDHPMYLPRLGPLSDTDLAAMLRPANH